MPREKIRCRDYFSCKKHDCPAHKSASARCWLVPDTRFRQKMKGRMFGKIEMCFNCPVFKANMDVECLEETFQAAKDQLTEYREKVEEQDKELEDISMELAVSFSEVFEALRDIAAGDPTVRIEEDSKLELIRKLKSMVNLTAENTREFVDLCHEFAIGLAEHFDVLHKVSKGDLQARIRGNSSVELLESLKKVTNETIESVQREISKRKQAQESLARHAVELEQRNEEVKQFAYIVSHDLRTPLVNVKGFAAELEISLEEIRDTVFMLLENADVPDKERLVRSLAEDIPEALEFIGSSASRMDSFINSVLKLSRLGSVRLKPEKVDAKSIVEETLKTMAHRIEKRGANVTVGDLPTVVADRIAMEQVFGNIIANAVLYLDPEREGRIEVRGEKRDGETIFFIEDNGRGIEQEDMPKVFAPFRRAGNQDVPGEGMGLAYVQAIVRRHGGAIRCESRPGAGTTFSFTVADGLGEKKRK